MIAPLPPVADHKNAICGLVHAAQQGDQHAFGRLLERHRRMVYGTARAVLKNHTDAEDVCQEVFMQAMMKIDSLHKPSRFSGWLRRIARNKAINKKRSKKRKSGWINDFTHAFGKEAAPEAAALANEQQAQVQQALGRLKKLDREIVVAFYFDGYSLPEIGRRLHRPTGTIKRRLHVARKRLAQDLGSLRAVPNEPGQSPLAPNKRKIPERTCRVTFLLPEVASSYWAGACIGKGE
jgi:RNA polymerase sigma-70 factor (ECF subfamily)